MFMTFLVGHTLGHFIVSGAHETGEAITLVVIAMAVGFCIGTLIFRQC